MGRWLGLVVLCGLSACAQPLVGSLDAGANLSGFIGGDDLAHRPGDGGVDLAKADLATKDMAVAPDMSSSCGSVTTAGSCSGQVLTYCSGTSVQTQTCATAQTCLTNPPKCAYVDGAPCNGVPLGGICDGNTLVYCAGFFLSTEDCAAEGTTCSASFPFASCN